MDQLKNYWGINEDLGLIELSLRALAMFGIALALLRLSGMRPFGKGSAFDNVIIFLLGGILSRGVVGATPFFSTIAGAIVLLIAHRLLAWASFESRGAGKVFKGRETLLYSDGIFHEKTLRLHGISVNDIEEQLRIKTQFESVKQVDEVYLERNGEISFVKKYRDIPARAN